MKKIILLIVFLGMGMLTFSQEWINVNERDYKLTKIDTIQGIVIADGYYDIQIEPDTVITYLGGFGNYFFYKGEKQNVTLSNEIIENLKTKTYGIKEEKL